MRSTVKTAFALVSCLTIFQAKAEVTPLDAELESEAAMEMQAAADAENEASDQKDTSQAIEPKNSNQLKIAKPQRTAKGRMVIDRSAGRLFIPRDREFLADLAYSFGQGDNKGTIVSGNNRIGFTERVESNRGLLRLGYGLNDAFFGIYTDWEQSRERTTQEFNFGGGPTTARAETEGLTEGLGDPRLFVGYRIKGQKISNVFRGEGSFSTGRKEFRDASTEPRANRTEGGNTIGASAGVYNHGASSILIGGEISYLYKFDRNEAEITSATNGEANYLIRGGNVTHLKAFMELPQIAGLGLEYAYTRHDSSTKRLEAIGLGEVNLNSRSEQAFTGFLTIRAAKQFHLIPSLSYTSFSGDENAMKFLDRATAVSGQILGRILF